MQKDKHRLGINMNTKPTTVFRDKVLYKKKSQLRKYGDIDILVAQADLVQQHHDPPIWHLAILPHYDRDAATPRYRPASRAYWPEQSLELTHLRGRPCSLHLSFYVCVGQRRICGT